APSRTWACGLWGLSIVRRPCPQRVSMICMCLCVHALSQYFARPTSATLAGWASVLLPLSSNPNPSLSV
ncbi:hypothetical protein HETIRDRAFT_50487, partial [Heterobasidion irregulare TC 32-1]